MNCPCENCILYAMCRSRLIDMTLKYTRIAALASTCILLSEYIYKSNQEFKGDLHYNERSNNTQLAWRLFNISKDGGESPH